MVSCADPANPSRPPRHQAGFSFALSLARQHLTGQGSGIASVTPCIRTPAARCAIALQTHAATRPDPARAPCARWRGLLGDWGPAAQRERAARPRLACALYVSISMQVNDWGWVSAPRASTGRARDAGSFLRSFIFRQILSPLVRANSRTILHQIGQGLIDIIPLNVHELGFLKFPPLQLH